MLSPIVFALSAALAVTEAARTESYRHNRNAETHMEVRIRLEWAMGELLEGDLK